MSLKPTLDPFTWFHTMRESNPVYYDEETEWWQLFTYNDVKRAIADYTTFSSEQIAPDRYPNEKDVPIRNIVNTDPPKHTRLRTLVAQTFNPDFVEKLAPRVEKVIHELLDAVAPARQADAVKDIAYPLPLLVIGSMLGVPSNDLEHFKQRASALLSASPQEDLQPLQEMTRYYKELIAQHRIHPQDDLLSGLCSTQIEGDHLTDDEVLSFCMLLLIAGCKTVTNLLGNALVCLDAHPEAAQQLRADPSLLAGAIEEVLRYHPPVLMSARGITTDVVLGGKEIKAGQIILCWLGSANRDETQFPQSDVFNIRRTPNPHVAFGENVHLCIGAPLARLEAKIALGAILERFSEIKRVGDFPLEPIDNPFTYGVKSLPVTFSTK